MGTQYVQDNRVSWKTYADGVAGAEDNVAVASAKHTKAHAVLGAVNHYYDLAALSPSAFESQVGQQRPFLPVGAMALTGNVNDATIVISAGNAMSSSTIDPQLFLQQIQQSVDPVHHGMSMPGPLLMPLHRGDLADHLSRAGLGKFLPGPSYDLNVVYPPEMLAEIEAEIAARPQPPGPGVSLIPFYGNYQNMVYSWNTYDFGGSIFHAGMMVSDAFLVKTVAQGLGKIGFRGVQRGAQALLADETGSIVIPNLGRGAEAAAAAKAGQAIDAASGQIHHGISTKIARALQDHPTLSGHYLPRDPRFTTQAIDGVAHRGYQTWHRQLDDEVIQWIRRNQSATPAQFEACLRLRYSELDLLNRFPYGF